VGNCVNRGLIGVGKIGRVHATNVFSCVPNARLVAVSDACFDAAKKFGADFGIKHVFERHGSLKGMVGTGNNTANRAVISDARGIHGALVPDEN
jgi:predicted homoserine dehydrogenase-like protein